MPREKPDIALPPILRRMGAQERYAQIVVDYLWNNRDTLLQTTEDGTFYVGSIHMLIRRVVPAGQAGDIVNILKTADVITNVSHGVWQVNREEVFTDEEGNPVTFNAPTYGHDSRSKQHDRAVSELAKRVDALEAQVANITKILVLQETTAAEEEEEEEEVNNAQA